MAFLGVILTGIKLQSYDSGGSQFGETSVICKKPYNFKQFFCRKTNLPLKKQFFYLQLNQNVNFKNTEQIVNLFIGIFVGQ